MKHSKRYIIIPIIFLSALFSLSSCDNTLSNGYEELSFDDLQLARRSNFLSSYYGTKVTMSGKITRVAYPDDKYGYACFVMQNGQGAIYGEFNDTLQYSNLIVQGANLIVSGTIMENLSFNDITLMLTSDSKVIRSDENFTTPYLDITSTEDDLFNNFGCLFHMDYAEAVVEFHDKDASSNMLVISKKGLEIPLKIQAYYHNKKTFNDFNVISWQSVLLNLDSPLLLTKRYDYVLLTILTTKDVSCQDSSTIDNFLL